MGDTANPVIPNASGQTGTPYKANIDAGFAVLDRLAWAFAPHEQSTPDMTVRLEAGAIFDGTTLSEVAAQSTSTITAPSTNPRIDRVVIDRESGAVSVVTGAEDVSPTAPAIPAGKVPVAQVALTTGTTEITNTDITDERQLDLLGSVVVPQAEAEAGTATTERDWTAERVRQAVAALSTRLQIGTPVATTSGTQVDFTSIPAGTKRITMSFDGVSHDGTSDFRIQIGDSGGIETSNYKSSVTSHGASTNTQQGATAGFDITAVVTAGSLLHGVVTLELIDSSTNTWAQAGMLVRSESNNSHTSAGSKSLSGELDRIRLGSISGDTFDAGKINITFE